jgi:hypothetical protein
MTQATKITNENAHEFECMKFSTEASMLDLPPGRFPSLIDTSLGNGQPFRFMRYADGAAQYLQVMGCIQLLIFNT